MGLSAREQRILRDIERDLRADASELARLLDADPGRPPRSRSSRVPLLLLLCVTACFLAAMILLGRVAAAPPQTDRSPAPETASVEQHQGGSGDPQRDPAAPTGVE
ncbi:DUF3040 domain-containing protein [Spirillospora sp. NPDC127200]